MVTLCPVILDIETTGLNPFEDRIVAIGVDFLEGDPEVFTSKHEHDILWNFFHALAEFVSQTRDAGKEPVLIGYNIQNFDIPFITARAVKYGYGRDAYHLRRLYRADLMRIVTYYMNTRNRNLSLRDVAEFLGIKAKDSVCGSDVPQLWEKGDVAAIESHCLSDLNLTLQLLLKLRSLVEHNLERRYDIEIAHLYMEEE